MREYKLALIFAYMNILGKMTIVDCDYNTIFDRKLREDKKLTNFVMKHKYVPCELRRNPYDIECIDIILTERVYINEK